MPSHSTELAEDRLIARYFRPLATAPGAFGLSDDAAIVTPPPGCDLVLTTDGVIAGVHFFPADPPENIGRKALRMNLSDLAAKGAKPLGFLLSVALPAAIDEAWIAAFAAGLGEDAARYGCPLLGGDTDRTPGPTSVSIAAFGALPHGTMVRRSTAKAGDSIVVTGTIGDAALGLLLRRIAKPWRAVAPGGCHGRTSLAALSAARAAQRAGRSGSALCLGGDGCLRRPCRRSRQALPCFIRRRRNRRCARAASGAARAAVAADPALIETVLTGGDDYEIVLTLAPEKLPLSRGGACRRCRGNRDRPCDGRGGHPFHP